MMQLSDCIAGRAGKNIINISIGLILLSVVVANFRHAEYKREGGVIEWDIKSYYAWLPALVIYNDLSLEFRRENIDKFGDLIWPVETPTGKHAIITTMGMSILYSPFFLAAHLVALATSWEADGYSLPYRFALTFSALFYLFAGLLFLKRILRRWFSDGLVASTIIAVGLGTNLYYYSSYEAPMSHAYSFSLIAGFIWVTMKFYSIPSRGLIIGAGLLSGLITLVRPVNIIVLAIFFLWDITGFAGLRERVLFLAKRYRWVLLMALSFVLVWLPQFIYWYRVSGQVFYFSYGEAGGRFFFGNPQVFNILFSIKKGWLVYTPMMAFALAGIFILIRRKAGPAMAISVFTLLNIYILSSWWNWWYGGGFGLRSFIDSYALMAIPLAAFFEYMSRQKRLVRYPVAGMALLLIFFNLFQTRQYLNNAIHWWWMNREAYRETFLRLHPTERFWELVTIPDHDLARQGIYREVRPGPAQQKDESENWRRSPDDEELVSWIMAKLENEEGLPAIMAREPGYAGKYIETVLRTEARARLDAEGRDHFEQQWAVELIMKEILGSPDMREYITGKARRNNIPFDSMLHLDAVWLYKNRR